MNQPVIFVDDDEDELYLYNTISSQCQLGDSVMTVNSGMELMQMLEHQNISPRIILLDINMPKMNGFDVLKRIRQLESCRYTPVVMLSTSSSKDNVEMAYRSGANSYLTKAITYNKIVEQIELIKSYWLDSNKTIQ